MAKAARAQKYPQLDPVALDSNHYKVEFENDRVRVLRVNYGPRERSVMHSHPDGVGVFLTSQHCRFGFTNGKFAENHSTAGEVKWLPGAIHLPENLGDQPLEMILVELKT